MLNQQKCALYDALRQDKGVKLSWTGSGDARRMFVSGRMLSISRPKYKTLRPISLAILATSIKLEACRAIWVEQDDAELNATYSRGWK